MKRVVLVLVFIFFLVPETHALKAYSYDSNGNRVYQKVYGKNYTVVSANSPNQVVSRSSGGRTYVPSTNGKRIRTYSRTDNGRTYVYNANGKRIKTYSSPGNGRTYVYDSNGKRIRTYSTASNGRTYVYNANGQRIRTYSNAGNGRTYVYAHPVQSKNRTFIKAGKNNYSQAVLRQNRSRVVNRHCGGGTRIVSTTGSLYRYNR